MNFLKKIPLFSLLLIIYNAAAFGEYYQPKFTLQTVALQFPLTSGTIFSLNVGDLLLIAGLALLYQELLKSTKTTKPYLIEHILSMLVFVVFIVEFFMVAQAGTVVFFALMIMSLLDVIGGFTVTLSRHVVLPGTAAALAVAAAEAEEAEEKQAITTTPAEIDDDLISDDADQTNTTHSDQEPTFTDDPKVEDGEEHEAAKDQAEEDNLPIDLRKTEPIIRR